MNFKRYVKNLTGWVQLCSFTGEGRQGIHLSHSLLYFQFLEDARCSRNINGVKGDPSGLERWAAMPLVMTFISCLKMVLYHM